MRQFYRILGQVVEVFHNENYSSFPWNFRIYTEDGSVIFFAGIPNRCETKQSALMRAYYRAKWIADGSYNKRYA